MTSLHRYSKAVVGVVALITCSTHTTPSFPPVGVKSVELETLVDDFIAFFVAGIKSYVIH